jgi:hypothetical protein
VNAVVVSGGHILSVSGSLYATSSSAPNPLLDAPWFGTNASGGDQSYGSNQGGFGGATGYTTAAPTTQAYTATQALGRNRMIIGLGGSYESWGTSGTNRNKADLVSACKGLGSYPNVINATHGCYVFPYAIFDSYIPSGSGYQTLANLIVPGTGNNWALYETAGGTGTIVPSVASGSGYFNVNYAYAWPVAAGTVPLGFTICGNAYGTMSNSQGPARTSAQYFVTALLTTNRTADTRFAGLSTNGAAPNADGLDVDNLFAYPNAGGTLVSQASWDGQNLQTNSLVQAYATGSTAGASSLLADGQAQFFATFQNFLSTVNPGQSYINFGNFGSYANVTSNGNTHTATANAMDGILGGGWLEDVAGVASFGWQVYMTAAQILANIDYGIGYLSSPQVIGVGVRLPSTDGSTTASFLTGGTVQTVTTGTPLEYQLMRCMAALIHMRNAYMIAATSLYDYALVRWYDEAGDDSLTQVNVKVGWLGPPTGSAVTLGSGVMVRTYTYGCVAFNAWGNGTQTVTNSQLNAITGRNQKLLAGTQQPTINTGANYSSYTFLDGDGLFLLYI